MTCSHSQFLKVRAKERLHPACEQVADDRSSFGARARFSEMAGFEHQYAPLAMAPVVSTTEPQSREACDHAGGRLAPCKSPGATRLVSKTAASGFGDSPAVPSPSKGTTRSAAMLPPIEGTLTVEQGRSESKPAARGDPFPPRVS